MARGNAGYFGGTFERWYVWLPLCLLFVAPFFDPRRPFRMLHFDLLVLLGGFGLSHFFFNKGEIGTSVPLVYPVLAYFLARMLVAGFRPRRTGEPLVPFVPAAVLVAGIVLLGGLRVGLDLTEGKVGDVGYASAVGATRIQTHRRCTRTAARTSRTSTPTARSTTSRMTRSTGSGSRRRSRSRIRRLRADGRASGRDRVRRAHGRSACSCSGCACGAAAQGGCSALRSRTAG